MRRIEGLPELPPPTRVDVWRLDLDRGQGIDLDRFLTEDERGRAGRFHFARDAGRFRMGRAMLRLGLAGYLGRAPMDIVLAMGWRGKPYIADGGGLHFNMAHSGGMGLIAFTMLGEVGIDIEAMRQDVEAEAIAAGQFTAREAALISAAGTREAQARLFLRFWTRKEAVLKAAGCGILDGVDTVDVSGEPAGEGGVVGLRGVLNSRWRVLDLDWMEGFSGAIAGPVGEWSVALSEARLEEMLDWFG